LKSDEKRKYKAYSYKNEDGEYRFALFVNWAGLEKDCCIKSEDTSGRLKNKRETRW
jgi:hypothetical protein